MKKNKTRPDIGHRWNSIYLIVNVALEYRAILDKFIIQYYCMYFFNPPNIAFISQE